MKEASLIELVLYSGGFAAFVSFLAKKLIDHYFEQQKKLKDLEAQLLKKTLDKFEYDINGLGYKLRSFEQKNESLSSNISKFDIHIDRLNHKIESLQMDIKDFFNTFDKRVKDLIRLEQNQKGV